jgi:hypothetical protein
MHEGFDEEGWDDGDDEDSWADRGAEDSWADRGAEDREHAIVSMWRDGFLDQLTRSVSETERRVAHRLIAEARRITGRGFALMTQGSVMNWPRNARAAGVSSR